MQVLKHILDYWTAGGILLVPLAAVSFSIWFYFLRTRSALLAAAEIPSGFEHRILETADEDRLIPGAVKYAAGAARAGRDPRQAWQEYQDAAVRGLRKDVVVLAALTAAAPLIGLLGTVTGMIGTFRAVMQAHTVTGGAVADGISQALITTQFGLIIALPGVFGVARLHRLIRHLDFRFAVCRSHLLLALGNGGRS
ncbi:MAG: MotA/TolQ/ExbB proton channel family protein [Kiritimatiellae bacterium]|nr:MotA/TolQ/ExbB proton channel family protein [Kiritimatiellia bacterium]